MCHSENNDFNYKFNWIENCFGILETALHLFKSLMGRENYGWRYHIGEIKYTTEEPSFITSAYFEFESFLALILCSLCYIAI